MGCRIKDGYFFTFKIDIMKTVECKELIISTLERRGSGKHVYDPIRKITQVFEKDGSLIAEQDPDQMFTKLDMVMFGKHILARNTKFENVVDEIYVFMDKKNCGDIPG